MITQVVIRGHSLVRQRLVTLTNAADKVLCVCGFTKAVECSCHTGLYQVINVRVWKLKCWSSLGMNIAYNSAIIVVCRLDIFCTKIHIARL